MIFCPRCGCGPGHRCHVLQCDCLEPPRCLRFVLLQSEFQSAISGGDRIRRRSGGGLVHRALTGQACHGHREPANRLQYGHGAGLTDPARCCTGGCMTREVLGSGCAFAKPAPLLQCRRDCLGSQKLGVDTPRTIAYVVSSNSELPTPSWAADPMATIRWP